MVGNNILLKPILASDFNDPKAIRMANIAGQKETSRAAVLFEILKTSGTQEHPDCVPGNYCIVSETALDFADPHGKLLVCELQDIKIIYRRADLARNGGAV